MMEVFRIMKSYEEVMMRDFIIHEWFDQSVEEFITSTVVDGSSRIWGAEK